MEKRDAMAQCSHLRTGFAQLAPRLTEGTHVFVQGEFTTRGYDRTIEVASRQDVRVGGRGQRQESDRAPNPVARGRTEGRHCSRS